jgi:hypothetical protein
VAALVLGARGGARLARALASVAWAAERIVVDPAERLAVEALPGGVRRAAGAGDPAAMASASWLLVLNEDEVVPPPLASEVSTVTARASRPAYRVGVEVHGLGAGVRLRGAPVRLARRAGTRLHARAHVGVELRPAAGPCGRLATRLLSSPGDSLAEAVDDLDADSAVLAAMLRQRLVRPRLAPPVLAALAAGGRVLWGRGAPGAPRRRWGRWTLAVLAGYRAVTAYAKLWEVYHREAAALG